MYLVYDFHNKYNKPMLKIVDSCIWNCTWSSRDDTAEGRRARTESIRRRRVHTDSTNIVDNSRATTDRRHSATSGPWSVDRIHSTSLAPPSTAVHLRLTPLNRRWRMPPLSTRCPCRRLHLANWTWAQHANTKCESELVWTLLHVRGVNLLRCVSRRCRRFVHA